MVYTNAEVFTSAFFSSHFQNTSPLWNNMIYFKYQLINPMIINNKIDIKELFLSLQKEIITKLQRNESHPGSKGDISEYNWRETLKTYLPQRYNVEKGFVVDSKGQKSQQIDLVIFDRQYSPLIFNFDSHIYIPAESVYGVIEIKQTLNKKNIIYAGEKAESVRELFRTNGPVYHQGGVNKRPRKPFKIISGILSINTEYASLDSKSFKKNISGLKDYQQIDFGCVLERGSFLINYKGNKTDYSFSNNNVALITFFVNLISSLQKLATVPVIELDKYIKYLK